MPRIPTLLSRDRAGICIPEEDDVKYYRGWQFVPMKGDAAMLYETADDGTVTRFMTVIEGSGEIERMPNPPMKRLFRPELLEEIGAEVFEKWWQDA